jgi:hypothetical protein
MDKLEVQKNNRLEKAKRYRLRSISWSSGLLDNDLKGASYRSGGADRLALRTPITFHCLGNSNSNSIIDYH